MLTGRARGCGQVGVIRKTPYISLAVMNSALEFHDSEVADIRVSGAELHVVFESAYIHRSLGRPGIDAGSGYAQPAEMVFSEAQYTESQGSCRGAISDGTISTAGAKFDGVVPLPFSAPGRVSATITFVSGGVLEIISSGVSCVPTGPARFVEAYDG